MFCVEKSWLQDVVMLGRVMFGKVVSVVVTAWCPVDAEMSLVGAVADPVELHIDGFDSCCFTVPLMIPLGVVLSVRNGVAGCG